MTLVLNLDFNNSFGNTGSKVCDISGFLNNGANSGSTLAAKPRWGNYRDFDGVDDIATITQSSSINNVMAFSVLAWINIDTLDVTARRISDKIAASSAGHSMYVSSSVGGHANVFCVLEWHDALGQWICPDNSMATSAWKFIGYTRDRSSYANAPVLYLNGLRVATTELASPTSGAYASDAGNNLCIGNNAALALDYDGKIGHYRIENTILSDYDMWQFFQQTRWQYGV